VQRGNLIKNEVDELGEKQQIVQDQTNPACPMCDQVLTLKRKQFLATKFIKHEAFLRHRLTRISNIIKRLKELLLKQHQTVEQLSKQSDFLKQQQLKAQDVAVKIEETKKDASTLTIEIALIQKQQIELIGVTTNTQNLLTSEEKNISNKIQNDPKLQSLQTEISKLEKEQQQLSGHLIEYSKLQLQIQMLEQTFKEVSQLRREQEQQPIRRQKISYLVQTIKSQTAKSIEITKQLEKLTTNKHLESQLISSRNMLTTEITKTTAQKDLILQATARLQHESDRIQKLKIQSEKINLQIKKIDDEIEEYSLLATAFGKNGIQALLIEQAIPEIEQEANVLLSRLTENQAQIFIESLKDLKGGGVKETLDIQISDSAGIRPYEMFSGGEAFRIDFALRIAISKLLARRAGTALQTLIIDEGFGSQDDEGLIRLMEAIYSIQTDFAKIIVVSHLSEFKDNFPAHFIVQKGPCGSTVSVEERG
jgi:exonuclease SbcC